MLRFLPNSTGSKDYWQFESRIILPAVCAVKVVRVAQPAPQGDSVRSRNLFVRRQRHRLARMRDILKIEPNYS